MPKTDPPEAPDANPGEPVFLSIIIPCHNEEKRLGPTLNALTGFLDSQSYRSEIIVSDNGSSDRTADVAAEFARHWPRLRVIRDPRRGKGLAVRRGMLEAAGEFRFMCDADLSMPAGEIPKFLPPATAGADVAIGSRSLAGSVVVDRPHRRLIRRAFNALVRRLVLPGVGDTQCGFKCFTAAAAQFLFRRQLLEGMAFDAEVLYIARRHGYRVVEVPIVWNADPDSRVRLWSDSVRMTRELLTIRRHARRGSYD